MEEEGRPGFSSQTQKPNSAYDPQVILINEGDVLKFDRAKGKGKGGSEVSPPNTKT
jgi:hypothetical protein